MGDERMRFGVVLIVEINTTSETVHPASTQEENGSRNDENECKTANYASNNCTDWSSLFNITAAPRVRTAYFNILQTNEAYESEAVKYA